MAVMGLVYYADDPDKKIFRQVMLSPGDDASELDDPCWITEGCDPSRSAVLVKIGPADLGRYDLTGTP